MWVELHVGEKVFSRPRNPQFGDEAARFERVWFIVEMVDDEIENFWGEGARHIGFWQGATGGVESGCAPSLPSSTS